MTPSGGQEVVEIVPRPGPSRLDQQQQRPAESGQLIFNPRRVLLEVDSFQQAVAFHRTEGIGEDLRAHRTEDVLELAEPPWPTFERQHDHRGPLVADPYREGAHRAGGIEGRSVGRLLHAATLAGPAAAYVAVTGPASPTFSPMADIHPARPAPPPSAPTRVVVLGAGGRAGRAVGREFAARGHRVTGVVRDARRHPSLADLGIETAEADATRGGDLVDVLRNADVVVVAVTPFSAPPPSFDGFDQAFYEHVVAAVAHAARTSPAPRLLTIGLFATLTTTAGRLVMDDPELFPPGLLPFAHAHTREISALRRLAPALDWLVLTPPAGLRADLTEGATGYLLVEPPVDHRLFEGVLSYGQLAQAVADQAETPTWHQTQVAVLPPREE